MVFLWRKIFEFEGKKAIFVYLYLGSPIVVMVVVVVVVVIILLYTLVGSYIFHPVL